MFKGIKSPASLSSNSMLNCKILLFTSVFLIFFCLRLYGDIIVTNDDMILNGKIIEDKIDDYIKFANYHGLFHIEYKQIKEIHRTTSFEEDIKIFQDKGKSVDEAEVKTNYQAGLEKLAKQEGTVQNVIKEEIHTADYSLFFSPFFYFNMGKLGSIVPFSFGGSVTGDIPLSQFQYLTRLYLTGIRAEIGYFHSEKRVKRVSGSRVSAGPLWQFPLSISGFHFIYCVSPEIGIGLYAIRGIYADTTAVKWNILFSTGPIFNFSSILLSPNIKIDYIFDGNVPLYGIGLGISFGYRF
jgi:hypothetical protein